MEQSGRLVQAALILCSLVPRFYEVEEGSISVDGIDIRQVTQESLRRQIGIVQQDVFLFTGTLRENILYGKLDASEEEVWEAARRARLDEFIRAQEQGMDTVIGERGVKLSGGQKQRLAIARMFLKNPSDSDFGRGHFRIGYGDRAGDSAIAVRAVQRPHDTGNRPQACND